MLWPLGLCMPRLTAGLFSRAVFYRLSLAYFAMTLTNITPDLDGLLSDLEEAALDVQQRQREEIDTLERRLKDRYPHHVLHHFVKKRRDQKFNITFEEARAILDEYFSLIK